MAAPPKRPPAAETIHPQQLDSPAPAGGPGDLWAAGSVPFLSGADWSDQPVPTGLAAASSQAVVPAPLRDLGLLGVGGMGEVRAVWDPRFGRRLALKLMRHSLAGSSASRKRFAREARMTAGLAHPGIVAVHERGELPDGRLWFTMKEVRGRTLGAVLDGSRAGSEEEGGGWSTRRLLETLLRVSEALAYAHSEGVVHRDLKPDNVMVGEFGEVLVMDWGLARRLDEEEISGGDGSAEVSGPRDDPDDSGLTQAGTVMGTPAWMAPEQARGEVVGPAADVYALGLMLRATLLGEYSVPDELMEVLGRATAPAVPDRYPHAGALAEALREWLEGARRRARALEAVDRAEALQPRMEALVRRAEVLEHEASGLLGALPVAAPVAEKRRAWDLQDEAGRLRQEAAVVEATFLQTARSALELDPGLPEAHALLCAHYKQGLLAAEAGRRPLDVARLEQHLRAHDLAGVYTAFLQGDGWVDLQTDPPGAEVQAWRLLPRDRRLEPVFHEVLGRTPLRRRSLPRGSWLLRVRAPGCVPVDLPVHLERGGHWQDVDPDGTELVHRLPRAGELSPEERLVPGGWAWLGGDPDAVDAIPRQRVWVPPFVMAAHPVTVGEYATMLHELVENGLMAEAQEALPRVRTGTEARPVGLHLDPDSGRHLPGTDATGRTWRDRDPVVNLSWRQARAYAAWRAERDGLPWRLPRELEWEKAARGVDGRFWPWGDALDPSWCLYTESLGRRFGLRTVDETPEDVSVYGVEGLAGTVRDWCEDPWRLQGWTDDTGRLLAPEPGVDHGRLRMTRGGNMVSVAALTRAAGRFVSDLDATYEGVGFRLVRDA